MSTVKTIGEATGYMAGLGIAANALRQGDGSMVKFAQPTSVEPTVVVEDTLVMASFAPDLFSTIHTIFSSYYLRTAAIVLNPQTIKHMKRLDRLNPNRDPFLSLESYMFSLESYETRLPMPSDDAFSESSESTYYPMAITGPSVVSNESSDEDDKEKKPAKREITFKPARDADQLANLSTGRQYELVATANNNTVTLPVNIRLRVNKASASVLVHILTHANKDITFKERFGLWRAGQINFWRDLVLGQDLIDEYKDVLVKDKSGILEGILGRRNKANKASFLNWFIGSTTRADAAGNRVAHDEFDYKNLAIPEVSLGVISNIFVITSNTAEDIQQVTNLPLSHFATREKIMSERYIMLLVVVDPETELVTIYHKGINDVTELSAKELKRSGKKGEGDLIELVKAFNKGQAPRM